MNESCLVTSGMGRDIKAHAVCCDESVATATALGRLQEEFPGTEFEIWRTVKRVPPVKRFSTSEVIAILYGQDPEAQTRKFKSGDTGRVYCHCDGTLSESEGGGFRRSSGMTNAELAGKWTEVTG